MTTGTAKREGSWWCEQDYRLLFEAIACGMTDEQIAEHTERRVSAVRSRAHMLVSYGTSKNTALALLRRVAAEPDFDWDPLVRMVHQHEGIPYWDTASDLALITGWGAVDPPRMQQLCDTLGIDEDRIAQRCLKLELARTRVEVVDRFGADEQGALYLNARISTDKTSAAVWVLAVSAADGQILHLSTHPTSDAAAAACHGLAGTIFASAPAQWTIAMRVCGEGSVRETSTGTWDIRPQFDPAASVAVAHAPAPRWWTRRFRRGAAPTG